MKRLLYFLLLILLVGCIDELPEVADPTNRDHVTTQFSINIPELENSQSRAINENQISNLYLLVFDENSRFISRHAATLNGALYSATLPQSNSKRTVHFIANYDWSGFDDNAAVGKDEGEVVATLQSTSLIFWQRSVFTGGINAGLLSSQSISLLRNMAKFSLINQLGSGLLNVKFAIYNQASAGTVAPFNPVTRIFESIITEPAGATYTTNGTLGTGDIYTFERKNSSVITDPTYVIIEGSLGGITYYYKIDIIDPNKNMYDIQRNTWYSIVILSVASAGYSTLEAAQSSPASNNITASVLLQSYPTISDGVNVLTVNKTTIPFTANGQTLQANATYSTIAGIQMNSAITVTLIQDNNFPVVNGSVNYDTSTGNLTANINNVPPNGANYTATVKIEAGNLSRTIRLLLHAPFSFSNISITPAVVASAQGSPATLKFTVPPEADYLVPFYCYISSAYLTPAFGNVEVLPGNNIYRYKWKVTTTGEQTINCTTNVTNASETVLIEADLFQRSQVTYTNSSNLYRFSNVVLNPNPVNFGAGNSVKLKFTVPTSGTFTIYTSNLTPTSGSISGGTYTYTATSAGEQTINFTTNKQNSAEMIRLTGLNYLGYDIPLKNQLIKISGTLTYRTLGSIINAGTITLSVGNKVVGIITTSATGTYQTSIEVNIGDVLTFSYTRNSTTYTATQTITAATMSIIKNLL